MIKTAFKGVMASKARLASTILSIVIGVAFVSGTFVFSDTINSQFDGLFSDIYAGLDTSVRSPNGDAFDESVLDTVLAVEGVETAAGSVAGYAQLIDANGDPIGGQGPPTLGFSWVDEGRLNPLKIKEGNGVGPTAPGEVVIDAATSETTGFQLGDRVTVATQHGTDEYTITGIANFGQEDTLLGATLTAFYPEEAQVLFNQVGQFNNIDVVAVAGLDSEALTERINAALPAELEAVTGETQSQEQLDEVATGLSFMTTALLGFAAVSVLVGSFIIYNTFRIIVGQRTRELALLRAVGAESRQVTRMVISESLIVGFIASAIGVFSGIGLAMLLRVGLDAVGFGVPEGNLILEPRTILVGMAVGVIVTLASAVIPARKAAKIPPIAAMRSEAVETSAPKSLRNRTIAGTTLGLAGAVAIAVALLGETDGALMLVAGGSLAVFLGVTVLAPFFARPIAAILGKPLRGIVGQLARENTRRSPRRTASTASALMIGVALVVFVSIFAASIKSTVSDTFSEAFPADIFLASANPTFEIPLGAFDDIADATEVATVSAIVFAPLEIEGEEVGVMAVDATTINEVYNFKSTIDMTTLGSGLLVQQDTLDDEGYAVGDVIAVDLQGKPFDVTISGTFEDVNMGTYVLSQDTVSEYYDWSGAAIGLVKLVDGVTPEEGLASVKAATSEFPAVEVSTAAQAAGDAEAQVDLLVSLFYGLLGLALLIAMIGIANTLTLSIAERTREIGLLRAVGMSRAKTSAMIRWEATMIGVFGAILGVLVGTALGWAVVASLADQGLSTLILPWGQLGMWLVLGGVAGAISSLRPARKAAKLDVLEAIAS